MYNEILFEVRVLLYFGAFKFSGNSSFFLVVGGICRLKCFFFKNVAFRQQKKKGFSDRIFWKIIFELCGDFWSVVVYVTSFKMCFSSKSVAFRQQN